MDTTSRDGKARTPCTILTGFLGAGKTTLVNHILRGKAHGLRVATVAQHQLERLQPHLDGSALAFMMAELSVKGEAPLPKPQEVLNHLGGFGLSGDLAQRPIGVLSGGQKARLNIASVMWSKPHVVILDEPTAALGVRETEQVLELIRSLKAAGKTVILISHSMKDVVATADRVTILRQGKTQLSMETDGLNADRLAHYILSGETVSSH